MAKRIYVGNLPPEAEAKDLERFCAKYGEVERVQVRSPQAQIAMGSGVAVAAKALNGHTICGQAVVASTDPVVANHDELWWT